MFIKRFDPITGKVDYRVKAMNRLMPFMGIEVHTGADIKNAAIEFLGDGDHGVYPGIFTFYPDGEMEEFKKWGDSFASKGQDVPLFLYRSKRKPIQCIFGVSHYTYESADGKSEQHLGYVLENNKIVAPIDVKLSEWVRSQGFID